MNDIPNTVLLNDDFALQSSATEAILSENRSLQSEVQALRSAMTIMSMKMAKYHENTTKMKQAYERSVSAKIHIQKQASRMEQLEHVLKLSHKSFLKMEQRNKALMALNKTLQQHRCDVQLKVQSVHHVSDSSDVSIDESSMMAPTNPLPVPRKTLVCDDECEVILA